jgi:hypothetical protein
MEPRVPRCPEKSETLSQSVSNVCQLDCETTAWIFECTLLVVVVVATVVLYSLSLFLSSQTPLLSVSVSLSETETDREFSTLEATLLLYYILLLSLLLSLIGATRSAVETVADYA